MQAIASRAMSALNMLNRYGAYLLARLRSNPTLSSVADTAQKDTDALYTALQNFWAVQKATMTAASIRDSKKYQLDAALRTLRTAVLVTSFNDRRSVLYKSIFPEGFTAVTGLNAEDELVEARKILQSLAEIQNPDLATATTAVQTAVDNLAGGLADYDDAVGTEQAASGALATAKQSYCLKYEGIFHQITLALGERRQAETYFRHARPPATAQPQPTPQPQPAPQPQTVPDPATVPSKPAVVASPASPAGPAAAPSASHETSPPAAAA